MKKRVLIGLAILFLIMFISFVFSEDNLTNTDSGSSLSEDDEKVNDAYACLENKVSGKCAALSSEEKIFTLLAIGKCKDEVIADALSDECWPSSKCEIKRTAQAILALDKSTTYDTNPAQEWLLTQQGSPEDVDWYLQIESDSETTCTITYDGLSHTLDLDEDRTLSKGAGNCLTLSQDDYWLKITPGCYDREFSISCDEDFLTALLFKRTDSSVIHVSDKTDSASASGTTKEKVNSACFLQGGECDYEGTLWASLVLDYKGHDISAFIPYLTTLAEDNPKYLPESFLYLLTGSTDFRTELLSRQRNNKYWDEYKDKFYDTAVALYSITDEPVEKINSKTWLFEVQDSDGCWEGNVRNTAFVLASIWPRQVKLVKSSCENSGYYCMADVNCVGDLLDSYSCPGVLSCCSEPKPVLTCAEQTGEICSSGETCSGGTVVSSSDLGIGENCCIGGVCEEEVAESECESYAGTCRPFGCEEGEQESAYACEFGDTCCVGGASSTGGSYWWIWLLIILIILTTLGIIFREKLKRLLKKLTKKGPGKGKPGMPSPIGRGPPGRGIPPAFAMQRRPMRRILPPSQMKSSPSKKPQTPKKPNEIENVLDKLKGMRK